jgi:hypothetical protein
MKYTKDELEFLAKNYKTKGIKFCADSLNRTHRSVSYSANKKLGLYRNVWKSKGCLENFKNVKDGEVAYVLGFLWADGYICEKWVDIELSLKDLLNVKPVFDRVTEWNFYTRKRGLSETGSLRKNSRDLCKFLSTLGYIEKSERFSKEIFQLIPRNLVKYFLRGFLDGDGNIETKCYSARFCGPINCDWTEFENILREIGIKSKISKRSTINKNTGNLNSCSVVKISGKYNFLKFLSIIYEGMEKDGIGLFRKFKRYKEVLDKVNGSEETKKNRICQRNTK